MTLPVFPPPHQGAALASSKKKACHNVPACLQRCRVMGARHAEWSASETPQHATSVVFLLQPRITRHCTTTIGTSRYGCQVSITAGLSLTKTASQKSWINSWVCRWFYAICPPNCYRSTKNKHPTYFLNVFKMIITSILPPTELIR